MRESELIEGATPQEFIWGLKKNPEENPVFENFSSGPKSDFISQIACYFEDQRHVREKLPLAPAQDLQRAAYEFHQKAGTLTPKVQESITLLGDSFSPRIRFAHQPNFSMEDPVKFNFLALEFNANALNSEHGLLGCPVYLAIDYDDCSDERFRQSRIPLFPYAYKYKILSGAVPESSFGQVMWAVPKPTPKLIDKWIKEHWKAESRILQPSNIGEAEKFQGRFHEWEEEVREAYDRSDTLTEFNMILLSIEMNRRWNFRMVFLPGHEVQSSMQKGYEYLIARWPEVKAAGREALEDLSKNGIVLSETFGMGEKDHRFPMWYVCHTEGCNRRVALVEERGERLNVHGLCKNCESSYSFDLGTRNQPNLEEIKNRMTPRVLLDNMLDSVALNFAGGVNYAGSAEHMLVTSLIQKKLGLSVPPQWFSPDPKSLKTMISGHRSYARY